MLMVASMALVLLGLANFVPLIQEHVLDEWGLELQLLLIGVTGVRHPLAPLAGWIVFNVGERFDDWLLQCLKHDDLASAQLDRCYVPIVVTDEARLVNDLVLGEGTAANGSKPGRDSRPLSVLPHGRTALRLPHGNEAFAAIFSCLEEVHAREILLKV